MSVPRTLKGGSEHKQAGAGDVDDRTSFAHQQFCAHVSDISRTTRWLSKISASKSRAEMLWQEPCPNQRFVLPNAVLYRRSTDDDMHFGFRTDSPFHDRAYLASSREVAALHAEPHMKAHKALRQAGDLND